MFNHRTVYTSITTMYQQQLEKDTLYKGKYIVLFLKDFSLQMQIIFIIFRYGIK